jgi:hypothetical protein
LGAKLKVSRATSVIEINGVSYDAANGNVLGAARKAAGHLKSQSKVMDGFVRKSSQTIIKQRPTVKKRAADHQPKTAHQVHKRAQRSSTLIRATVRPPKNNSSEINQRSSTATTAVLPSMVASASHIRLEKLLDNALTQASSHKLQTKRRTFLPKRALITLLILIVLTVTFFAIWRDVPKVAIYMANRQAHVSASLPAYTPLGYAFSGPIKHSPDSVTIQYASKANGSLGYSITQKTSSWNSSSLVANAINPKDQIETSSIAGTTVYVYGVANNATWVSGGIWYTLANHAHLTTDQILSIVQSI